MNIEENNKMIDIFMGSKGEYISHKDIWGGEYWGEYIPNKYNSDWNLLMAVVEKIFEAEESIKDDLIFKLNDSLLEVNKESLYNSCLECINSYNEQNK